MTADDKETRDLAIALANWLVSQNTDPLTASLAIGMVLSSLVVAIARNRNDLKVGTETFITGLRRNIDAVAKTAVWS